MSLQRAQSCSGVRFERIGDRDAPGELSVDGYIDLRRSGHGRDETDILATRPKHTQIGHERVVPGHHSLPFDQPLHASAGHIFKTGYFG